MNPPLVNVITRASRKNSFHQTWESVQSQIYSNVNHIVTYETDEMKNFLSKFDNITLIRVPNLKSFPKLGYYRYIHSVYDNYLNPSEEWFETEMDLNYDEFTPKPFPHKSVKPVRFYKENIWAESINYAPKYGFKHFPYNLYIRIAESYITNGWICYVDDDDIFTNSKSLTLFIDKVLEHGEDCLYLSQFDCLNQKIPNNQAWKRLKIGLPFTYKFIGGSNLFFHSKYKEYTAWDEWSGADYRTAKNLEHIIQKKIFIDQPLISLPNSSGRGQSN